VDNSLAIRVMREDRMLETTFRGPSAVAMAVEFLQSAPICHPDIYLWDGETEVKLEPRQAASYLVEMYYLQTAG
jgi:hypothetical protein